MFKPAKNEELANKIEQLLSGQVTLDEAKKHADRETKELLELAALLANFPADADPSFRADLEEKLLGYYQRPRLKFLIFNPGLRRIRTIAAASLASLVLLSGMAMALPGVRKLIIHPPSGNIEIVSNPSNAQVFLDNTLQGTAPLRIKDVAMGRHELKVSKENYEDWSGVLNVKQKSTVRVAVELNKIEVIVVKPKHTVRAQKSESPETKTPAPSLSVPEKEPPSQQASKQDTSTSTGRESTAAPHVSASPSAAVDSSPKVPELLLSSESLVLTGNKVLFLLHSPGKKENVLDDATGITGTALSPSGTLLAYVDKGNLKIINLATKESKVLYEGVGTSIKNPHWSADEASLLFTAPDEGTLKPTVFVAQISSRTVKELTSGTVGSFSPNGQEIAYAKEAGGIFITDSGGNKERQILPQMKVSDLKWSPSGIKIGFIGAAETESTSSPGLYVLNKDGTELKKIATGCTDFSWSPDGQRLVFEKNEKEGSNIYVAGTDGANAVNIAKNARSPQFSPDSKRVAFTKNDGVYIADLDGTNSTCVLPESNLGLVGWISQR